MEKIKNSLLGVVLFGISILLIFNFSFAENEDSSNLVKKIEISDYYGVNSLLVNLHLEIGRGEASEDGIFYMVELLNKIKYYSDLDIIDYLGYTFDIKKSLNNLLYEIGDVLDEADIVISSIKNNLVSLEQDRLSCDELKDVSDKNFSLALKDLDSKNMELNLNKSLEYERCSGDSRIYYNVQNKILEDIEFYYEFLKNKYTYFLRNKLDIIKNYPEIYYDLKQK
ncbi:MAG TPA: hypothetical protein VJ892_02260 [Candidatus Absconditabacterales bacterium]|nr:hypothetical protein [Candidatus Absconditabacterales bacterium]